MILGCVNLSFAYVEGESLLMALKDIALSSGRQVQKSGIMKNLLCLKKVHILKQGLHKEFFFLPKELRPSYVTKLRLEYQCLAKTYQQLRHIRIKTKCIERIHPRFQFYQPSQNYLFLPLLRYELLPLCFSACTSASLEPSYVLRAIGADEDLAHSSIR